MEKLVGDANRSLVVVLSQSNIYIYVYGVKCYITLYTVMTHLTLFLCAKSFPNDAVLACDLRTVGKSQVTVKRFERFKLHIRAENSETSGGLPVASALCQYDQLINSGSAIVENSAKASLDRDRRHRSQPASATAHSHGRN